MSSAARPAWMWIGTMGLLLADAIFIFDAVLLKRYLDRPAVIIGVLAAAFALFVAARWSAHRIEPGLRGPVARRFAKMDGAAVAFAALFLILLGVQHFVHERANSDGRIYFVQVRSVLIDHDVDFARDAKSFGARGMGAGPGNPGGVTSYPVGTAFTWTPFFAAAHVWLGVLNLLGGQYPRDGYFNPYQRAVGVGSLVYGTVALVLIYFLLRREYARHVSFLATLAVSVGGVAAWYMSVDATWSHAVSMFATTAFVAFWIFHPRPRSPRTALTLGLLAGLMVMARWQNALFLILPAADALAGVVNRSAWRTPRDWWREQASFAGGVFVGFFPQLLFWRLARGGWLDMPVSEHAVDWSAPFLLDALFHAERGLFTWTPLLGIGALGLALSVTRRPLNILLLIALLLQIWVNGTVWADHGFGARRFENSTVLFAIGTAAVLDLFRRRPMLGAYAVVLPLLVLNVCFMAAVATNGLGEQRGSVSFQEMTGAVASRLGNPFSLPENVRYAWRYDSDLALYERLGSQFFNNARIDIGDPTDERFLGGGWAAPENNERFSFRWMTGVTGHVLFRTWTPAPYTIEIRCSPLSWDGSPQQTLQIVFNGVDVNTISLGRDMETYRVEIPAHIVRAGLNHLVLRAGYARTPASVGLGEDLRELSVVFDGIDLLRR